jgi:hypothetical protein
MKPSYLIELEAGLQAGFATLEQDGDSAERSRIAILMSDPLAQRLVEAAAVQLELVPTIFEPGTFYPAQMLEFELVVAEEAKAHQLRAYLEGHRGRGERLDPALIAVRPQKASVTVSALAKPLEAKVRNSQQSGGSLPRSPTRLTIRWNP